MSDDEDAPSVPHCSTLSSGHSLRESAAPSDLEGDDSDQATSSDVTVEPSDSSEPDDVCSVQETTSPNSSSELEASPSKAPRPQVDPLEPAEPTQCSAPDLKNPSPAASATSTAPEAVTATPRKDLQASEAHDAHTTSTFTPRKAPPDPLRARSTSTSTPRRRKAKPLKTHTPEPRSPKSLDTPQKASRTFSPAVTRILEAWYQSHYNQPYPDQDQVEQLSQQCNLRADQIRKWCANKRNRGHNTLTYNGNVHPKSSKFNKPVPVKAEPEPSGQGETSTSDQLPRASVPPQPDASVSNQNQSLPNVSQPFPAAVPPVYWPHQPGHQFWPSYPVASPMLGIFDPYLTGIYPFSPQYPTHSFE